MTNLEIHTLVCKKHVRLASEFLPTLPENCEEKVQLVLHDDGSLSRPEIEFLLEKLPDSRVIRRDFADAKMSEHLRNFPALRQFRGENVFGLKLLDIALLGESEAICYCDADVWFFRRFHGLFTIPANAGALFMRDTDHSVCVRSWQLLGRKIALAQFINAGFFAVRREVYDLDLFEKFVRETQVSRPYFVEQTAWSLLAWHCGAHWWNTHQVALMHRQTPWTPQLVVGHFVKPFRWRFPELRAQSEAVAAASPTVTSFETTPVKKMNAGELLRQEFARVGGKINRRWGR